MGVAVGVVVWPAIFYAAGSMWDDFVEATGDTLDECERADCGTLGDFTENHSLVLLLLFLAGTAIPSAGIAWAASRLLRRA